MLPLTPNSWLMKFKFIYTFFSLCLLAFIFSSSSGGRAASADEGNTGAPGDDSKTCVTCHGNNAAIQVTLSIDVEDENGNSIVADGYMPGTVYTVVTTINVDQGSPSGFGFQLIGLNAPMGMMGPEATDWSDPASNVQIASVSSTGRTYAEHKGPSDTNEFRVKWTAPAKGSGTVTFYSCGNGVNRNGETGGDNAACNTLVLEENMTSSTFEPIEELELTIAPNPVEEVLNLQTVSPSAGDYQLILTDMLGRQVYQDLFRLPQGEANSPITLPDLQSGIYTLQLVGNGKMLARQMIKK